MPTISQLVRKGREKLKTKRKAPALAESPQKRRIFQSLPQSPHLIPPGASGMVGAKAGEETK